MMTTQNPIPPKTNTTQIYTWQNNRYGQNILCNYCNPTSSIQIARLTDSEDRWLERVVLPHQSIVFEARPEAYIEIYTNEFITTVLADRIECMQLQIQEQA